MLKVARTSDERRGYELMSWWDGRGAAEVLAFEPDALLLERAEGDGDLAEMARRGEDERACRILCETASGLHARRRGAVPELHVLDEWFRPLFAEAERHARLSPSAGIARRLLADQRDIRPLHGDLHHGNVLDFGPRGWLAIDPHGLLGERFFDYANIFTNPDLGEPGLSVARLPGRLESRLAIVTEMSGVDATRMLRWIAAWTALSAAWFIGDGDDEMAAIDLEINEIAFGLLQA